MNLLRTGNFFGETNTTTRVGGITLTDTEYTHNRVDWHFHENAYFTFILKGRLTEVSRKETYDCSSGSLLFHSWQEPHYNIKPAGSTRGFHIEFARDCFADLSFDANVLEGSFNIDDPDIKFLIYKIFRESKLPDDIAATSIEMLLLDTFSRMLGHKQVRTTERPVWVGKLKEILMDGWSDKLSLRALARELGVHPVHISRGFPRYFNCTLGDFVRKLRIERSLALITDGDISLTEIAHTCGFADQSHFLRSFKRIMGTTPSAYRKLLLA